MLYVGKLCKTWLSFKSGPSRVYKWKKCSSRKRAVDCFEDQCGQTLYAQVKKWSLKQFLILVISAQLTNQSSELKLLTMTTVCDFEIINHILVTPSLDLGDF